MDPRKYGPFSYSAITDRLPLQWPDGARVAVWVIPNMEFFALNERIPGESAKVPNIPAWSQRDYGNRVGVFRMAEAMTKFGIRGTVALNSDLCAEHPNIIRMAVDLKWEFMGHCESNTRVLNEIPADDERRVIRAALDMIEKATGTRPRGWLGSGLQETWNTLDYLADGGVDYVADWVNDDQPYLMSAGGKKMVSIPYTLELNDRRIIGRQNRSAEDFECMIRNQFDVLYREGAHSGRVMAIALHPYLIGAPHRITALERAFDYVCGHEGVWLATGSEIVDSYLQAVGAQA